MKVGEIWECKRTEDINIVKKDKTTFSFRMVEIIALVEEPIEQVTFVPIDGDMARHEFTWFRHMFVKIFKRVYNESR